MTISYIATGIVLICFAVWWYMKVQLDTFRNDATVGMSCKFYHKKWYKGKIVGSNPYLVSVYHQETGVVVRYRSEIWPV